MSDNATLPATGETIRTVDKAGVETQVTILDMGGTGAESLLTAGQKAMAASVPVVLASDQSSLPVTVGNFPATQAVTGTFFQGTQPVSIAATVGVSGPLTDTQLRATAVPVSGTVAVTGALTDAQLRATAVPVSNTQLPAALAAGGGLKVEGIAGGVALPVSIAGTVTTNTGLTQPLTDTQLRATAVPVSGTVSANATLAAETTKVIGTVNIAAAQTLATVTTVSTVTAVTGITNALPAGTNKIGTVDIATAAASAKGTQGANGVPTQDLKDAGRSSRVITLDSFAVAATAETIMTMSYSADNGTPTTGTSYTVTAGKRFRIQQVTANLHTIAGNTTAVNVIVRLRTIATAPALVASPLQFVFPIQGVAAANQAGIAADTVFPDGWELPAGAGLAVTVACAGFVATTAAPKVDITITGYEY